jgi:hypothetical protein
MEFQRIEEIIVIFLFVNPVPIISNRHNLCCTTIDPATFLCRDVTLLARCLLAGRRWLWTGLSRLRAIDTRRRFARRT